jgi:transposase-like protein
MGIIFWDYYGVDIPVCPYCGAQVSQFENSDYDSDHFDIECEGCGKEFTVNREVSYTFTSEKTGGEA